MKRYLLLVNFLLFVSAVEAKSLEFKSYLGFPIVVQTTTDEGDELEEPKQEELEDLARAACEYVGYTSNGKFKMNPLHDQGTRGPKDVYQLTKNGKFKAKAAHKILSFQSVSCVLPEEVDCKNSSFDMDDLQYVLYRREDCK